MSGGEIIQLLQNYLLGEYFSVPINKCGIQVYYANMCIGNLSKMRHIYKCYDTLTVMYILVLFGEITKAHVFAQYNTSLYSV